MKQKNRLASRLYIITTAIFIIAVLFSIHIIVCDIFVKPPSSLVSFPNHNYGYSVPVKIQLNQPGDSTITYHNADRSKSGQIGVTKHSDTETRQMFNNILKDTTYTKTLTIDSLTMHDGNKFINKEFDNIAFLKAEGYMILKPKDLKLTLLLATKNYLLLFTILFVLWSSSMFFRALTKDFSFSYAVSRRLWIVGNAILCYQVINWILCLIIQNYYEYIKVESLQPGIRNPIEMYKLYPDTEFNIGLVILSLALIVISRLLDYGNDLQEENELTI